MILSKKNEIIWSTKLKYGKRKTKQNERGISTVTHVDEWSGRNVRVKKMSQEISCLCMRLLVLKFSTKKAHKIHSIK